MGGGITAAREGKLQLFLGGAASAVERHRALLEVLGDPGRIVHTGGHGTGYTAGRRRDDWLEQQRAFYERVIAEDSHEAEPALRLFADEGRELLPHWASARRALLIASI